MTNAQSNPTFARNVFQTGEPKGLLLVLHIVHWLVMILTALIATPVLAYRAGITTGLMVTGVVALLSLIPQKHTYTLPKSQVSATVIEWASVLIWPSLILAISFALVGYAGPGGWMGTVFLALVLCFFISYPVLFITIFFPVGVFRIVRIQTTTTGAYRFVVIGFLDAEDFEFRETEDDNVEMIISEEYRMEHFVLDLTDRDRKTPVSLRPTDASCIGDLPVVIRKYSSPKHGPRPKQEKPQATEDSEGAEGDGQVVT